MAAEARPPRAVGQARGAHEVRAGHGLRGDDELRAALLALQRSAGLQPVGPPPLSARELDVLACVAVGHTNADAAAQLGILPETVKSYLRSAMRKLGTHTRWEAVSAARRAGWLP